MSARCRGVVQHRPGHLRTATAVLQKQPPARSLKNAAGTATPQCPVTYIRHYSNNPESVTSSLLCPAVITDTTPSGSRGVLATYFIPAGTTVLAIRCQNYLTVPKHGAALAEWRVWLQLFASAHGELPPTLQAFLSDVKIHPTMRLATWLLYIRKKCRSSNINTGSSSSSNSSSNSSNLWCSYMSLLAQPSQATAAATAAGSDGGCITSALCVGGWSQAELQLLEPPALQAWCSYHNQGGAKAAVAGYVHLSTTPGLAELQLADSSADVSWAMGLIKTRAHGSNDILSLYPLYDMLNHAEPRVANLKGRVSKTPGTSYEMQAVVDIHPGTELTHTYITPISNPQLLLGWGFTLSPKTCDWVMTIPQHYGCLPLLRWKVVVQAAAAVLHRCQQQQQQYSRGSSSSSRSNAGCDYANLRTRLISAAANLPIKLPASDDDDVADDLFYTRAAAAYWQQQQQQQRCAAFTPMVSDQQQQARIEGLFGLHLDACMKQQCAEPIHQQQQNGSSQGQRQQQMQIWTATAVRNSCIGQLIACNTTAAEDAALLQQLQQRQQVPSPPNSNKQQQQQQLSQYYQVAFQSLQDEVISHLSVMQAYHNLRSLSDRDSEAAKSLLLALQEKVTDVEQQCSLTPWQDNAGLKKAVQAVQQYMQSVVPPLLQQQADMICDMLAARGWAAADGSWRLHSSSSSSSGVVTADESSLAHLDRAKVVTAVAARYAQKVMMQVTADLCQQTIHTLQR